MKKFLCGILCCLLVLSGIGCKAKRLKVCSTVYPVMYLLERIGGNRIDSCMIGTDSQITRAQISPTYKTDVKDADIVFYVVDIEPFMPVYQNSLLSQKITLYDVAINSRLYDFKRYTDVKADNSIITVDSEYYPDTDVFKDVDVYKTDPYVWLDAIAYTSMAKTITDYLVTNAPLDKDFFLSNYEAIQLELVQLDSEFQALKNLTTTPKFASITPSFGNWQRSYGTIVYPISLSKYGIIPNQEQLEIIMKTLKDNEVHYIIEEEGLQADQTALLDKLVSELGLKKIKLYNLSFLSEQSRENGEDYFSLMHANLEALRQMIE